MTVIAKGNYGLLDKGKEYTVYWNLPEHYLVYINSTPHYYPKKWFEIKRGENYAT